MKTTAWQIPKETEFRCKIKTPQFKNGKIWTMYEQCGIFDKNTLLFTHTDLTGHDVQFFNIKDLERALIEILD
jgi:hypothetical protein